VGPEVSRVLLLGSTGFLGRHVRERLLAAPDVEVVTATHGADTRVDLAGPDAARILTELDPDVVINCAGVTSGDPAVMAAGNVIVPANLVEALQALDRRTARRHRLVHLGSAAEYGKVDDGVAVREDHPERPIGIYGVTKLAATRLVRAATLAGFDGVVLRVTNPVGPGAPPVSLAGRMVGEIRRASASGSDVTTGPLDDVRDFVDVRDVADAIVLAATRPPGAPAPPPVLNVGSGIPTPVRAVVDGLVAASGFTGGVRILRDGSPRSAAVPWQQSDVRAIDVALGWRPVRDLDTSLRELWLSALQPA
jgi:nucleoside-diphosphate-sugar epimerase